MVRSENGREAGAAPQQEHTVRMENRRRMELTGVQEVTAYDAASVTLETAGGLLVIGGSGLRVRSFSAESGKASIEGEMEYLQYRSRRRASGTPGILRRVLG